MIQRIESRSNKYKVSITMYIPVEHRLCISECAISSETVKIRGSGGAGNNPRSWIIAQSGSIRRYFLPAYEYNHCRDHRGEEHKAAEYS